MAPVKKSTRGSRSKKVANETADEVQAEDVDVPVPKTKPNGNALFYPFRALGYITEHVPFCVNRRGTESFVTVSAGKAFQIFNCEKMRLVLVGPQLGDDSPDISALACRNDLTFVGTGSDIVVCRRTHKLCTFVGPSDATTIKKLFVFGGDLISIDSNGNVRAWDISSQKLGRMDGNVKKSERKDNARQAGDDSDDESSSSDDDDDEANDDSSDQKRITKHRTFALPKPFKATSICHPDTYLNKVVLGGQGGELILLNVKTGKTIHTFTADGNLGNVDNSPVTCVTNAPALDVVAVGFANGTIRIHNVKIDQYVTVFGHDGSKKPVRDISFSTGRGEPLLAAIGDSGTVSVWNLERKRLRTLIVGAHDVAGCSVYFFPGSPILMTSGHDNSVKHWIFDNRDGTGRLLRFRAGHSSPPSNVTFYGEGGTRLLSSGGDDRALRVFSSIQDQQSLELSQSHVERRAKRLKITETALKLPPISQTAWSETRERDWANVVTCHVGEPRAYTWRLKDGVLGERVLTPPARVDQNGVSDTKSPVSSVAISACGNFAFVGGVNGDAHRFNLQSGLLRGTFKRDVAEDAEVASSRLNAYRQRRLKQLNLPGGVRSIWNMADHSKGADEFKRKSKPTAPAHDGAVSGIVTDGSNEVVVTCGLHDGICRVWGFVSMQVIGEIKCGSAVVAAKGHGPSGLVAVACADSTVRVLDVNGIRRVRTLRCGGNKGNERKVDSNSASKDTNDANRVAKCLEFSSDGRWVLAAGRDGCVRVWDVPASRLLQTMVFSNSSPVTGMSLSPSMDMLATTHSGRRGVYLWANSTMYAPIGGTTGPKTKTASLTEKNSDDDTDSDSEDDSYDETLTYVTLPTLHAEHDDAEDIILGSGLSSKETEKETEGLSAKMSDDVLKLNPMAQTDSAKAPTPRPAAPGLATMALLPRAQWLGLLHLEQIRERNKPIEGPKKPAAAPFFLPTTAGLAGDAVFDLDAVDENEEDDDGNDVSKILTNKIANGGDVDSVLLRLIRAGASNALEAEEQALADAKKGIHPNQVAKSKKKKVQKQGGVQKRLSRAFEITNAIDEGSNFYYEVTKHLRSKGPSALDAEIRSLGPWDAATMTDAEAVELEDVLEFFAAEIPSGRNFELLNALLAHFLRVHGSAIRERESLRMRAEIVRAAARRAWSGVDSLLQEVRCALGFFGGQHGQ